MLSRRAIRAGIVGLAAASLIATWAPIPAAAQDVPQAPVEQDGNDIVGGIRSQYDTLNSGASGGSSGTPPSCSWSETLPSGETIERTDGTPRWRTPGQGHDFWADGWEESEGEAVGTGLIYRYECWHPDMGCSSPAPSGDGCLGEAIQETFCGSFLCLFDQISPPNLAQLAVDGFVETLGPPQAAFSPADQTLVNFETYMWLTNAPADGPADGEVGPWSMSVPGLTVTAWATASDITWRMGDGTEMTCPVTRDQASAAAAPCSHTYLMSSAQQPDQRYQGAASMTYEVRWQASGAGLLDGSVDALRTGSFTLAVAEAQAINTGRAGSRPW